MATPSSSSQSHSSSSPPVLHDYGPDSGGRLKGVKVVKPVVVGNIARYFGKKREEDGHTHQWTVFLRPYLNEDYSVFIKKVQFKLHDSYPNPTRIVTKPPFEVTETGWGEFEVGVKVHFIDPVERPVTMYHLLRLFEANKDPTGPPIIKKVLSAETYDEIVFQEPTKLMMALLESIKPTKPNWKPEADIEGKKKVALQTITQARSAVKDEIEILKNKLKLSKETINAFKLRLMEAQSQQSATDGVGLPLSASTAMISDATEYASATVVAADQTSNATATGSSSTDVDTGVAVAEMTSVINPKTEVF